MSFTPKTLDVHKSTQTTSPKLTTCFSNNYTTLNVFHKTISRKPTVTVDLPTMPPSNPSFPFYKNKPPLSSANNTLTTLSLINTKTSRVPHTYSQSTHFSHTLLQIKSTSLNSNKSTTSSIHLHHHTLSDTSKFQNNYHSKSTLNFQIPTITTSKPTTPSSGKFNPSILPSHTPKKTFSRLCNKCSLKNPTKTFVWNTNTHNNLTYPKKSTSTSTTTPKTSNLLVASKPPLHTPFPYLSDPILIISANLPKPETTPSSLVNHTYKTKLKSYNHLTTNTSDSQHPSTSNTP